MAAGARWEHMASVCPRARRQPCVRLPAEMRVHAVTLFSHPDEGLRDVEVTLSRVRADKGQAHRGCGGLGGVWAWLGAEGS